MGICTRIFLRRQGPKEEGGAYYCRLAAPRSPRLLSESITILWAGIGIIWTTGIGNLHKQNMTTGSREGGRLGYWPLGKRTKGKTP